MDTIDASGVTRSSTINLTPGTFSSIGIYTKAQQLADIESNFGASVKSNVETFMSTLDGNAVLEMLFTQVWTMWQSQLGH